MFNKKQTSKINYFGGKMLKKSYFLMPMPNSHFRKKRKTECPQIPQWLTANGNASLDFVNNV